MTPNILHTVTFIYVNKAIRRNNNHNPLTIDKQILNENLIYVGFQKIDQNDVTQRSKKLFLNELLDRKYILCHSN